MLQSLVSALICHAYSGEDNVSHGGVGSMFIVVCILYLSGFPILILKGATQLAIHSLLSFGMENGGMAVRN